MGNYLKGGLTDLRWGQESWRHEHTADGLQGGLVNCQKLGRSPKLIFQEPAKFDTTYNYLHRQSMPCILRNPH